MAHAAVARLSPEWDPMGSPRARRCVILRSNQGGGAASYLVLVPLSFARFSLACQDNKGGNGCEKGSDSRSNDVRESSSC
jgi:hypothetical protein